MGNTTTKERNQELYRFFNDKMATGFYVKKDAFYETAEEFDLKISTTQQIISTINAKLRPKSSIRKDGLRMIVVPDTQCKHGGKINHIEAAARYIVAHKPDVVVVLGDWWDFESLSVFKTKKSSEGLRVKDDIDAGIEAMDVFMKILRNGITENFPRLVFTHGNHSLQTRLPRFIEAHPELEGLIEDVTTPFLENHGWEVYPFLEVVKIEGIRISHYIQNPHSLKGGPIGGAIDTMLKNAGFSFIMGHQQTLKLGMHYLADGTCRLGIVAGAFYQHDEGYMSIQGNRHWRGIIMLNEVKDGSGDPCVISMKYLLKKYDS